MNKTELINRMMDKTSLTKAQAQAALDATLETITESLQAGDPVQFTGFGTFKVNDRQARIGRNPQTGEKITIPATTVATFSVGKELKEKVKSPSVDKEKKGSVKSSATDKEIKGSVKSSSTDKGTKGSVKSLNKKNK